MIIQTRNVSIDCHGMQRKQQPIKVNVIEKRVEKDGPYVSTNFAFGKVNNKNDSVAYMQVKDITKNQDEQVFIFNGWTFASDPSLTPFDHAIYDLQLLNCNKA